MTLLRTCFLVMVALLSITASHAVAAADGAWTTGAPMPTPRSELAAAALEDRIFVAGGIAQFGTTPTLQVYDPAADRWESRAPLPAPRHHFGMAALDGRIYVSGGFPGLPFSARTAAAEVWAYDPIADAWTPRASLPAPRGAHAMVALGGRLWVVGGVGPDPARVFVYDPADGRWSVLPAPLPTVREHLAAAALDGRLYVVGGRWRGAGNLATLELLDPATGAWTRGPDMPTPRGGLTAVALGGRLHVTGGEDLAGGETFAEHAVYDPATATWSVAAPLPTARHGLASGVVAGRWYVIGGGERAGAMTILSLSDKVEAFAP